MEITVVERNDMETLTLKSDHCGMEIVLMDKKYVDKKVKIRPLWDGNFVTGLIALLLELKSDHCGMEINMARQSL